MRKKLLIRNTLVSFLNQGVTIICGFILPRMILQYFGSETNGLVSSVTQFLGFITFLELGMGSVVKASLYEPLAKKNNDEISKVVVSSKRFFQKIALILVAYTIVLAIALPLGVGSSFDFWFTSSLVIIISISSFAQYYFGMAYQLMLNADQKTYIPTLIGTVTIILNTVISAVLMMMGANIQMVKLGASLVHLLRPVFLNIYVKKHYQLNEKIEFEGEPIKQKWNGIAQHIAYVVTNNTDVAVLTVFSTLVNVSIYTVYHNVTNGIYKIISSLSVGISAMIGNVMYTEDKKTLEDTFEQVEWFFHVVTVLLFTVTGIMIIPFVRVYTSDIADAEYVLPLFGALMTIAMAAYSIRTPYQTMVYAAGHYKQTQWSSIIEMLLNVFVSIFLVYNWGIVGVAIGTLVALTYRTIYFVIYLKHNILYRKITKFVRLMAIDAVEVALSMAAAKLLPSDVSGWGALFVMAVEVTIICGIVCVLVNLLCYRTVMLKTIKKLKK